MTSMAPRRDVEPGGRKLERDHAAYTWFNQVTQIKQPEGEG